MLIFNKGMLMGSGDWFRHAMLLAVIVSGFLCGNAAARENKKYLPKTTVDTLIQQAFYNLNAVTDNMPGSDSRRQQALADAKRVSAKLRTMARGDPNERYVLWKTGELECQIYLEERDIVLRKLEKSQKERNAIINVYNAEVGKNRPDFIVLKKTIDGMKAWDPSKAGEMQSSMDQRRMNISRQVIYRLEKAMLMGDLDKTQREFDYCKKNRALLTIPADKYDRFDARIKSLGDAIKLKPAIDEQFALIDDYLPHNMLKDAGKCLQEIQGMLYRIDRDLPPRNREEYTAKTKKITSIIDHKEDSLIAITYSILATKGENAALDHLERVLKPCGVSGPKIGQAHTAIMNVATVKSNSQDTTFNREIKALSQNNDQAGVDFDLVRSAAKKKAQQHADSVRLAEEENLRILDTERERASGVSVQIYTLLEENRIKEACSKFITEKKSLEQFLYKDAFFLLQSTITQALEANPREKRLQSESGLVALIEKTPPPATPKSSQNPSPDADLRQNQEKATQVSTQIYGMLEANQIEAAYKRFTTVRKALEKYLCREAFTMLETTVMQSYDSYLKGH